MKSFSNCSNLDFYLKNKPEIARDFAKSMTKNVVSQASSGPYVDMRSCFLCGQRGHVVRNCGQQMNQNLHPFIKDRSKPIPVVKEILKRPTNGDDETHILFFKC